MNPCRPIAPHLFGFIVRPEDAEGKGTHRSAIGGGPDGGEVAGGAVGKQHGGMIPATLSLAMSHAGAGQPLDKVLTGLAVFRQSSEAAIGSSHLCLKISGRAQIQ